ncbi:hypothetical protein SUGI_1204650 [Cryptomeria japonica]|nr:hypothetical protein SUGI_1204650 [Cryptomeria japonica]
MYPQWWSMEHPLENTLPLQQETILHIPIYPTIVGDPGQTDHTKSTLAYIEEMKYDVLLLPGDLSYADTNQPLWDSFGKLVEPLASSRPWMVTQGNHEIETTPRVKDTFRAYNARWRMPFEQSGSSSNLFYSFEVVGVHVIMLGSYADFGPGSNQYKWLEADLGRVDRKRAPWLIALVHAPWYNTNTAHHRGGEDMRKVMEKMLYSAKVDMVFAGHVHAYERFEMEATAKGLLQSLGKTSLDYLCLEKQILFGHGELTIMNATHANWTWHRNEDGESVAADQVLIQSFANSTSCVS